MSTISTHVLDTASGRPAAGVSVSLERIDSSGTATPLGTGTTDSDGRLRTLLAAGQSLEQGDYRLRFDTAAYLARAGHAIFYPAVSVDFRVTEAGAHYHVPLLLSPFGYSTYRGS
jgi:5-hydroxyisourate hydrolase